MNITGIGEFLRKSRKARRLTQGDVADQLGVTAQAVSKWERGENLPDVAFFPDISKILAVGVDEILGAGMEQENLGNINGTGNKFQNLVSNNLFEEVINEISKVRAFGDLDLDLDFFVYLSGQQKSRLIQEILTKHDYHPALDDMLPYCNTVQRNTIITHILDSEDYALLEQMSAYMSNEAKADALDRLLTQGRYDIIEDNMPAFNRKHRDIIVDYIGENPPEQEIIENFIPFFDKNQRERLRESLSDTLKEEEE